MEFILGGAAAPPEAAVFSGRAPPGQGNIVYIDTQPRAPDFGHLKGNTKLAAELESVIAKGWADRDKAKTELVEALRRAQVSTVSDVVELMHTATEEDARLPPASYFCGAPSAINLRIVSNGGAYLSGDVLEKLDEEIGRLRVEIVEGRQPLVFTAPNGIYLSPHRGAESKTEVHTTRVAKELASLTGGTSITWSAREHAASAEGATDAANANPSSLEEAALRHNPWNRAVGAQLTRFGLRCLHVDIHGRPDYSPELGNTKSDCDVGVLAMHHDGDRKHAAILREHCARLLREAFQYDADDFTVDDSPAAGGFDESGNLTLTQQSVRRGVVLALCINLSRRLRNELVRNKPLARRFAAALQQVAQRCLSEFCAVKWMDLWAK